MELMSSLLLCALAAALPQALGESKPHKSALTFNRTSNTTIHKQILVNRNTPHIINSAAEIQAVFKDLTCRNCSNCMHRAVKAHVKQTKYKMMLRKPDELYYEVINEKYARTKRSINLTNLEAKIKRGSKKNKSVTVTKYSDENGKVFALKVKELSSKSSTNGKKYTCKLYSVSQTLACDTFNKTKDAPKKKVKRDKKSKNKTTASTSTTTTPAPSKTPYNFEVSDSYMPSLEDMY